VPKLSLPVRLALLVAGTTLPLIAFAAFTVFENYQRDRKDASERVLETTRGIRFVLDAEVKRMTSDVQVLALSESLRTNDFDRFRRRVAAFLTQYAEGAVLLVADRDGRQIFSSRTPDAKDLPPRNNREMVNKVFSTKTVQYSNLFVGVTKQEPIVTVEVPAFRDGQVVYDVSFSPPMEIFQSIVEKQRPSEDWTISIFDAEGTNFARVPNPKDTIGKQASPLLFTAMFGEPEAALQTVSLEGVPLFTTFVRSEITGWTVAAGIAQSSLVNPLWRNLAITSLLGAVLLLIGLGFAVRMATTIARGELLNSMLIEELNHRVKNTLAIVQAIAVQTFHNASKSEREKFEGRLGALAEAHNLLSQDKWQSSALSDVIGRVLEPYSLNEAGRVRMSGPPITLSPRRALIISMIIHEIATNAAKYGALSNANGNVRLDWEIVAEKHQPKLRLIWAETGGPPVSAPVKRGFGSRLIERSARDQLGGEATVDFLPRGVVYTIVCPLDEAG